jgi:putative ABC transport system permease protein
MRFNYIGIGEFPAGELGYPLKSGRYPGAGEFVAEERMVEMLGLHIGDSLTLNFRTGPQKVTLSGTTPTAIKGSSDSLVFNLQWLQEQMGLTGQVTLQLLGLVDQRGIKDRVAAALKAELPDLDIQLRKELDEIEANMGGLKPMAIAFGIAGLFASIFLVAGSFHIAVQERQRELALLRAVGATQRQVMRLVLREAWILGAAGSTLGVLAGWLGAATLAALAARSLGVEQHPTVVPWLVLALEWALGTVLAVFAAWKPAAAAGKVAPLAAMRPDAAQVARAEKVGGIFGLVLMGAGAALALLALQFAEGGGLRALLGALAGLVAAAGLIAALPRVLPTVVSLLARPLRALFPAEAVLAGRSVLRHRKRSSLTVATLVLGVMLLTSVATIFGEVAENGERYTRSQFASAAQVEIPVLANLTADLTAKIAGVDGVTGVATAHHSYGGSLVDYDWSRADPDYVAKADQHGKNRLALKPVDLTTLAAIYDLGRVQGNLTGGGVTLTEEQARNLGLSLGDTLTIALDRYQPSGPMDTAPRTYTVTAIVEHLPFYKTELAVDPTHFPAAPLSRVYFNYDPSKRTAVKAAVLELLRQPKYNLARLRDLYEALEQERNLLNQRWAIVGAVVGIVFMIGTFALVNSIVTGLHQRRRELATLRAVGSTPAQTTRQVVLEAVLLGLAGSLLGIVAGGFFTGGVIVGLGTDGDMVVPVGIYLACLVVGPALAVVAALGPARRVARGPVARVLQAD